MFMFTLDKVRQNYGYNRMYPWHRDTAFQTKRWVNSKELWRIEEMKLKKAGASISEIEVLNISKHGFWLLVHGREYFLPFELFPWFKDVSISLIFNVELPQPHHLYWPDLDVDLELESIESPEKYPLMDSHGLTDHSN